MFTFEKEIEDELNESIFNDYELLCSMYQDDIKEIINDKGHELKFLLRINYTLNIDDSDIINTINRIKLKNINLDNGELLIPYWIVFSYDKNTKILIYKFYILWIKENTELITKIKEELNTVEEPFIYNTIELIRDTIDDTLNNLNIISFLNEIKLKNINNFSLENALLTISGANEECPDFLYEEKVEDEKDKQKDFSKGKNEINKEENYDKKKNLTEYELFFENGGVKSQILPEKDYVFQSHGINVKNIEEVNLYREYLLSNNKIKKATRNVFAYRFFDDKSNTIVEDYDDDGEHYAGTRILGYLQKMKIFNILILVSRFNGDLHLKQHSTKYLTIAEILIKDNINLFSFEK